MWGELGPHQLSSACLAFAPAQLSALLVGRAWDKATLEVGLEAVARDIVIADNAPGGKVRPCVLPATCSALSRYCLWLAPGTVACWPGAGTPG